MTRRLDEVQHLIEVHNETMLQDQALQVFYRTIPLIPVLARLGRLEGELNASASM